MSFNPHSTEPFKPFTAEERLSPVSKRSHFYLICCCAFKYIFAAMCADCAETKTLSV